jgi:hypothetical protein
MLLKVAARWRNVPATSRKVAFGPAQRRGNLAQDRCDLGTGLWQPGARSLRARRDVVATSRTIAATSSHGPGKSAQGRCDFGAQSRQSRAGSLRLRRDVAKATTHLANSTTPVRLSPRTIATARR